MRTSYEEQSREKIKLVRRTYGKGFFDGLRFAGVENPEEFMTNLARLNKIEASLSARTKKVLHALPVDTDATDSQVVRNLMEAGKRTNLADVQSALAELVDCGLVIRKGDLYHRRSLIASATPATPAPAAPVLTLAAASAPAAVREAPAAPAAAITKSGTPLDRLATLVQDLRSVAKNIDDAILETEMYLQEMQVESRKFAQLRELLKEI